MRKFTRILITASWVLMMTFSAYAQDVTQLANVGIGVINPAQKLDVAGNVKFSGALMPAGLPGTTGNLLLSAGAGVAPTWLANGANGSILVVTGGVPTWTSAGVAANAWQLTGNAISATFGTNFIGTSASGQPIEFEVNNTYAGLIDANASNIYFGRAAGGDSTVLNTVASQNVAIGWEAFATLASTTNVTGVDAIGVGALHFNQASNNNAVGGYSLHNNTTGTQNDAFGYGAGFNITTGNFNASFGFDAMYGETNGTENFAGGDSAMFGASTSGTAAATYYSIANTAIGVNALGALAGSSTGPTGSFNTAMGYESGRHITTGNYNTSFGYQANYANKVGFGNVAVGYQSLFKNTFSGNTAIGTNALFNNNTGSTNGANTAVGDSAMFNNTTGVKNVAVGYSALAAPTVANNNVAIGYASMSPTLTTGTQANNVNVGYLTSEFYTSESNDVAVGAGAMEGLAANVGSNPSQDVAIGAFALANAGTGANFDIAIGSGTSSTLGPLGATAFTGQGDIAIGFESGNITNLMTTGSFNTYLGYGTYGATTQSQNVAIGYQAHAASTTASQLSNDVAIGFNANATGFAATSNATAIGASSIATGTGSTAIGASANAGNSGAASNTTAIGASSTASANNATAIGPSSTANTANTIILGNAANVNGASQTNVGLGTTAPARELEVAGTTNTIRVDGLATGGTFNIAPSAVSNILYSVNSTGDIYSLPNTGATTGMAVTLSAGGYPQWAASAALPTATAPLVVTGSVLSLQGAAGTVLVGTGGGSSFFGAGPIGDVLEGQGAGNAPIWTTIAAISGGGDNWGSQVAITDSNASAAIENTISGNGLSSSPLRLAQQGATNNQLLSWNTAANTWKPLSANSALTTNNILGGTAVVITNGTGQVVGASNVTFDVQGIAGAVLYGKGAGTSAAFTTVGTTGQVLTSNAAGAPTWTSLASATGAWAITGNSGTTPGTNFLGTTSAAGLDFEVNGAYAGAVDPLMTSNSAGNVYLGAASTSSPVLNGAGNNDAGDLNVAIGLSALASAGGASYVGGIVTSTVGSISSNVALGAYSLSSAVFGGQNTAVGAWSQRLFNFPTANTITGNTSEGAYSLYSNSTGKNNTAIGSYSLYGSGTATALGSFNTALGYQALYTAGAGIASNTAIGSNSLYNTIASKNTAVGDSALFSNTTGTLNTAVGYGANVSAGNLTNATAIGAYALATQSNTLILGQISGIGQGTANTNVGIGTNAPDIDAGLSIKTLHFETQPGSASTTASNTGAGVSSAALTGTDVGGNVGFSVAGGSTGAQVTVNFATAYVNAPTVILTPANSAAGTAMAANKPYITSTTTGFVVNFATGGTAAGLLFNYFVIETQ